MADVLGVLAFMVFIACVIATAAAITWLVVRLSPPKSGSPSP
jgi:hypothetical protein